MFHPSWEPPRRAPLDAVCGPRTLLGRGAFGRVYSAVHLPTGRAVAVKQTTAERRKRVELEVELLRRCQGAPGVVELVDVVDDPTDGALHLVMERCDGGTVSDLVARGGGLGVKGKEARARAVAASMLATLRAVHARSVYHGDVKPHNMCLLLPPPPPPPAPEEPPPLLRLVDFGCGRRLVHGRAPRQISGSPCYMAPEVFTDCCTDRADIWSLGVSLFWMHAERLPHFEGAVGDLRPMSPWSVAEVLRRVPPQFDLPCWAESSSSREFVDFLSACLAVEPSARPSAAEALTHPWFRGPT